MNRISTLFILLFATILYTACSIPASCEATDYVGTWSGDSDCDIAGQSEVVLEITESNGTLSGTYNNIDITGGIEGCFLEMSGEVSSLRSIDLSGTILLGNLTLNVYEVFLNDTIQTCSGNLK